MKLTISAKCSDMFSAALYANNGQKMGYEYDGYVPGFMPGSHYGDYVTLDIDVDTGQILNWDKPTMAQLKETFNFKIVRKA